MRKSNLGDRTMARREIQVDEKLPVLQTIPLSFQHLFAMFGASILIPIIVGVSPALHCFLTVLEH